MAKIEVYFDSISGAQLLETRFFHATNFSEIRTVRGKTGGAFSTLPSFQWTLAVRALATLLVGSYVTQSCSPHSPAFVLSGEQGSPAASLDFAITKGPFWIRDMFGVDASGRPLARRLINRTNSERKRPGPVLLSLNANFLNPQHIHLYTLEGEVRSVTDMATLLENLLESEGSISKAA